MGVAGGRLQRESPHDVVDRDRPSMMAGTGDGGPVRTGHARYVTAEAVLAEYGDLRKVLVVTALPLEMRAVMAHVEDIGSVAIPGGPICECGCFRDLGGDWLVVAVESGRGNTRAQSAAERARRDFRDFDVQLMVGVGGSLKPEDAPLGSVVASERVHSVRSAKHGKDVVSSRPQAEEADPDLVHIARKVARDELWWTRVRDPRNGVLPAREAQTYPGGWPPVALVAPMGSSEEVLADGEGALAKWLRERYGDACIVEMEGYGAMFAASCDRTPAIVLRGVSDLAGSDKTPKRDALRQPVAACHAAAFGFEMLSHWAAARATVGVVDRPQLNRGPTAGRGEVVASAAEAAALPRELAAASALLLQWPRTLPDGEEIERPELKTLADRVEGGSASTTVVLGAPGSGKSALLAVVAHRYMARDWPVLAIKADVVDGNVSNEAELGEYLGLGVRPSVALRTLAASKPMLLIIDQLDALAAFLDLKTSRLSVLLGLVRRIGGVENIHIILSSRTFEFEHDVRLKSVDADYVRLELPALGRVLEILEGKGVSARDWPADAQDVIRSPQALAIYLGLGEGQREPFATYRQMLDALWDERVAQGAGGADRVRVATNVAETMAKEEALWLAGARFDGDRESVDQLAAAGVLRRSEGRIGFTHQTVFEHVLARRFAQGERAFSEFVLERQESLFVRPKLLAGLNYLRDVEESRYHGEIDAMWSSGNLRRHVRMLLIDFLGSQDQPTDREETVVGRALNDPGLRWHAFRAVSGSGGWFARLADGFVAPAMLIPGESAERMVGVLIAAWEFARDRVVEVIREGWANDRSFDLQTWGVLSRVWDWSEDALQVACAVVQRTDIGGHDVNYVAETLGAGQPDAALRLVYACLQRELSLALAKVRELEAAAEEGGESEAEESWLTLRERTLEKLVEGRGEWSGLGALAEAEPELFLRTLWPWFESLFGAMLDADGDGDDGVQYRLPYAADFRFSEEGADLPPSELLAGLRIAVEGVADTKEERWLEWAARLGKASAMAAQRVVAHGFARSPEKYAKKALEFLLGDERRFVLGSTNELAGTSRRLIEAASAYWEPEEVARFEEALDSYRPRAPQHLVEAKGRREWGRTVGRITHPLRQALAADRRSAEAERRIREDSRVYPDEPLGSRSWSGSVGSIMDAAAIGKASDDDVVNAFRLLPDATGWDHPKRFMAGGNIQLAREFAVFSKSNPERAGRILGRLTPENGTRAAGNVLEALAEKADPNLVIGLLNDLLSSGFDSEGFRESACRAIGRLTVDRNVEPDDELVDLVERWLTNPLVTAAPEAEAEQEGEEGAAEEAQSSHDVVRDSILWGGGTVSLVPGGEFPVAECLIRLRLQRREHQELHRALNDFLDRCKEAELWCHLLHYFGDPPAERADAAKGLLERVLAEMPELVSTGPGTLAIARAAFRWAPALAHAELDRWRSATGHGPRQAYGEVVALAATAMPVPGWTEVRLAEIIRDSVLVDARAGAALTAVNRWSDGRSRVGMSRVLLDLLASEEEGVWKGVFDLFRVVDRLAPDKETVQLLDAMCERIGTAPRVDPSFLAERLGTLLPHEAPLVGRLAMGLVECQPGVTGLAAANLVDLAVTLHRLGGETRTAGTELFESLLDKGVPEARTTLDEIDKRKEATQPRRPRVRRRRR